MTPLINQPDEPVKTIFSGSPIDEKLYSQAREETILKVPIADYFRRFIDHEVDLELSPKCMCPFHEEDTPSFRYRADLEYWNCFGCKKGGTVIDLHRYTVGFNNYYEALWDLKDRFGDLYGLTFDNFFISKNNIDMSIDKLTKKKDTFMSLDEFMDTSVTKSLPIIQGDIERELRRLKEKDFSLYVKACMKYDSMKLLLIDSIDEYEKVLEKLVEVNAQI